MALIAAVLLATGATAAPVTPRAEDLLRRSDVGAFGPDAFRARVRLRRGADASREIEVWRSGARRTLVRFLDARERGRFLLRLDGQLFLLAPGARQPLRLSPNYRLYGGASLDEVLGLRLADEYAVESSTEESDAGGAVVTLELRARAPRALFPSVRYVVRAGSARPLRAEYRLRGGRAASAVEFVEWSESGALHARRVRVRDLLRKGALTEVEVLELQPRPVPDALFDLRDGSARAALAGGAATAR